MKEKQKERVKVEMPRKYRIGIDILVPLKSDKVREECRKYIAKLASLLGAHEYDDSHFEKAVASDCKVIVSRPLIHSIAETKMDGLNSIFELSKNPFEAFLVVEE